MRTQPTHGKNKTCIAAADVLNITSENWITFKVKTSNHAEFALIKSIFENSVKLKKDNYNFLSANALMAHSDC